MTNLAAVDDVVEHVAGRGSLGEEPGVPGSHGLVEHEARHLEAVGQFRTDEAQVVQEGVETRQGNLIMYSAGIGELPLDLADPLSNGLVADEVLALETARPAQTLESVPQPRVALPPAPPLRSRRGRLQVAQGDLLAGGNVGRGDDLLDAPLSPRHKVRVGNARVVGPRYEREDGGVAVKVHVVGEEDAQPRLLLRAVGERGRAAVGQVEESDAVVAGKAVEVAVQPRFHVAHVLVAA